MLFKGRRAFANGLGKNPTDAKPEQLNPRPYSPTPSWHYEHRHVKPSSTLSKPSKSTGEAPLKLPQGVTSLAELRCSPEAPALHRLLERLLKRPSLLLRMLVSNPKAQHVSPQLIGLWDSGLVGVILGRSGGHFGG